MMKIFSYIRSFHASHRLNPIKDGTVRNIFLGCLIELAGSFLDFDRVKFLTDRADMPGSEQIP